MKLPNNPDTYQQLYERYHSDISRFLQELLGFKALDKWQKKLIAHLEDPDTNFVKISIAASHGVGKSYMIAGILLHALLFQREPELRMVAPTAAQLYSVLGKKLKSLIYGSPLTEFFTVTERKIYRNLLNSSDPDQLAYIGFFSNTQDTEPLQGSHPKYFGIDICDEASGVYDEVFTAFNSCYPSPGAQKFIILISNPIRRKGFFASTFLDPNVSKFWVNIKVPYTESTYADRDFIETLKAQYGEDSPIFKSRALAEFPVVDEDALISPEKIKAAVERELSKSRYAWQPVIAGLDVARYGSDRSVLVFRQGNKVYNPILWTHLSLTDLAREVMNELHQFDPRPEALIIDATGYGAALVDIIREHVAIPVVEFISSATPVDSRTFLNLRSETFFKLKDFIEGEADIPQVFASELEMLHYQYTERLQLKIASKDFFKKEYGVSPDLADALMLTMHDERAGMRRLITKKREVQNVVYAW